MSILLLTGPPAAGKNTIGALFARQQARCAVIDVDLVRAMIVQPHRAPWEGEEGARQQRLGVRQACLLAVGFAEDGWEVMLHDALSAETLSLYRHCLAPLTLRVVQLLPDRTECRRRFLARGPVLTDEEFAMIYRQQAAFTDYDLRIDTTRLAPDAVVSQLGSLFP